MDLDGAQPVFIMLGRHELTASATETGILLLLNYAKVAFSLSLHLHQER